MKTKTITVLAAATLLPITGFAQTPPAPPAPPIPPVPPAHGNNDRDDKGPKVPTTYLGVETSSVPNVVSEQLGLAKGFGLVVDYVVPDGPAAAAGVQQNDILKMLNDQILTEPGQLAKLVRSFPDGTTVTLTVLRKGAEQKLTVKLAKRDVPARRNMFGPDFEKHFKSGEGLGQFDLEGMKRGLEGMKHDLGEMDFSSTIRNAVHEARRATLDASRDARREALRAREEVRRRARELRVTSKDGMKTTKIDLGKAQILYTDPQGEMKIESVDGKKILTAKDPQGRLLFSGPVGSKEELDKLPPDVRARYEKLEQKDLPAVGPGTSYSFRSNDSDDEDDDEADDDSDDESDSATPTSLQQVSARSFSRSHWNAKFVLI